MATDRPGALLLYDMPCLTAVDSCVRTAVSGHCRHSLRQIHLQFSWRFSCETARRSMTSICTSCSEGSPDWQWKTGIAGLRRGTFITSAPELIMEIIMLHDMVDYHVCSGSIYTLFCNLDISGISCVEVIYKFCCTEFQAELSRSITNLFEAKLHAKPAGHTSDHALPHAHYHKGRRCCLSLAHLSPLRSWQVYLALQQVEDALRPQQDLVDEAEDGHPDDGADVHATHGLDEIPGRP